MKKLAIILVLAMSVCSGQNSFGQTRAKKISGAWIESKLNWQLDDYHKNQRWTSAEVLYFFEDGRFGIIDGSINQTDNEMEISYGDSQTVYFGSWKWTGKKITVTYRLIYRDIRPKGGEKESTEQQEHLVVNEEGEIVFHDLHFRKEPKLNKNAAFTISEKLPSGKPGDR
jgi:hypothetical protein